MGVLFTVGQVVLKHFNGANSLLTEIIERRRSLVRLSLLNDE